MNYIYRSMFVITLSLLVSCGGSGGGGTSVTPSNETLHGRTDGKGLDLVIVSEAFTSSDLGKFHTAADEIANHILTYNDTMKLHASAWNIHRMDKLSATNDLNSTTNTAYEAYFNCRNISRMLCLDRETVTYDVMDAFPQYDHILVLVNSSKEGGSGGSVSVASLGGNYKNIAIHEIGHRFMLGDEYSDPTLTSANITSDTTFNEDRHLNLTANSDISTVKWKHWLDHVDVDMYEGGWGLQYGIWRPTATSIMNLNTTNESKPAFGPVNLEQWALSVYWYAGTHYGYSPESLTFSSSAGLNHYFTIEPSLGMDAQQISWYVDGELKESNSASFTCCSYKYDHYSVEARISDKTGAIRQDKVVVSVPLSEDFRALHNLPVYALGIETHTGVSSSTITWNVQMY